MGVAHTRRQFGSMERFGITLRRQKDGRQLLPARYGHLHQCSACGFQAKTQQGLAGHQRFCKNCPAAPPDAAASDGGVPADLAEMLAAPASSGPGEDESAAPDGVDPVESVAAPKPDEKEPRSKKQRLKKGEKFTKGADKRRRYTWLEKAEALELHDGALVSGMPHKDEMERASGTTIRYQTLWFWAQIRAEAIERATDEVRASRNLKSKKHEVPPRIKAFNKRLLQAFLRLRKGRGRLSVRTGIVFANRLSRRCERKDGPFPRAPHAHKKHHCWRPTYHHVYRLLKNTGWVLRMPSKTRPGSAQDDANALQVYIQKLRCRFFLKEKKKKIK